MRQDGRVTDPTDGSPGARKARQGRVMRTAGRLPRLFLAGLWRRIRRLVQAEGAAESGLSRLIDLHAVNGMGDALITVGLASTLFFAVPVGQARSRVALYLALTMVPFALLAPIVGPVLDRFPHGRRYAIATTMLARGFLAYVMAGALHELWLYPAAFGALAMSKAYGVARSSAVPRLLPPKVTLVAANSRLSLATIVAASVLAAIGAGLGTLGASYPLYLAAVVYVLGMVLALRLPSRVDSDAGERTAQLPLFHRPAGGWRHPRRGDSVLLTPPVTVSLTASASLRALSGFLTLYLAFLLRTTSGSTKDGTIALGAVVAAAAVGSFVGTTIGARLRLGRPQPLQLGLIVLAAAGCVVAAVFSMLLTAVLVALLAGVSNSLAKLALDSMIQTEVAESVRSSAFARSETLLQLSWVVGGAIGLIPFGGWPGYAVAAAGLLRVAGRTAWSLRTVRQFRRQQDTLQSAPAESSDVTADPA